LKESPAFQSHIAVLDDDIRFIRMVERALAGASIGIQPVTTLDTGEALRVITSLHCDAALVDVYMYGEAAGFDMVRLLRENAGTSALPLLLTTGARREVGRQAAFLQQHGCGVLLKPFGASDLVVSVRELLSGAPPVLTAPTLEAVHAPISA
jgi:DNA-binding response OmpR family regulator